VRAVGINYFRFRSQIADLRFADFNLQSEIAYLAFALG